ncbi:MAG: hypothetical protein CMP59_09935 [Flavobacteriales bacterium]|nr:hypothetical protein [Flavobacteriales bacterium]
MNKRKWIITLSAVFIFAFAIVLVKILPESQPKVNKKNGEGETAVNTQIYQAGTVSSDYNLSGRLIPAESIELFAEVGGKAKWGNKVFKSGTSFKNGELLLQIDDREIRNNLLAQKSQAKSLLASMLADVKLDYPKEYKIWQKYLESIDIEKDLPPLPKSNDEQFELFLAGRNVLSRYYEIKELETRLKKYRIEAPFEGSLTAAYVDEGALVRVGQAMGEFISTRDYELEASVELSLIDQLKIGDTVEFKQLGKSVSYKAIVARINQKVDPASQLVKVYFSLKDKRLRSGIYLEGKYKSGEYSNAMRIPAQALLMEKQLFIAKEGRAQLQEVEVLEVNTNQAVISGLEDGTKIIIDPHNAAFEGSKIIEIASE